jgi:hypothetical protein
VHFNNGFRRCTEKAFHKIDNNKRSRVRQSRLYLEMVVESRKSLQYEDVWHIQATDGEVIKWLR